MWPIAPAPSLHHAPAACSTASPPALLPRHAPRLAASLCPHQEIQREGSPFLQSPRLAGSGGGAHVQEGVGARSGCMEDPRSPCPRAPNPPAPPPDPERLLRKSTAWGRGPRHGEDENLLQPHATAPCLSCRCHSPPRAVGLMMEDPPSSLHRRRCCRFCCLLPARPRQRNDWRRTWCRGMEYEYGCWFR